MYSILACVCVCMYVCVCVCVCVCVRVGSQLIQDDKGTVAIIAFGLPYCSHEDDSVRGVLTAIDICQSLEVGVRVMCALQRTHVQLSTHNRRHTTAPLNTHSSAHSRHSHQHATHDTQHATRLISAHSTRAAYRYLRSRRALSTRYVC